MKKTPSTIKKSNDILSQIKPIIQQALHEDIGSGDVTSRCTISPDLIMNGRMIAKEDGVIAGLEVAKLAFVLLDESIEFMMQSKDGQKVKAGETIATIHGNGQALLSAERVALNFLQRMSGIATMTARFVAAVSGTKAVILDTRKTVPGLRLFDKWAVQLAGAKNHRFGLDDMVLIKENHITAAGSILAAVKGVRKQDEQKLEIEVEVKNLIELEEALALHVDRILLDNMSTQEMQEAVRLTAGRIPLEASGNVTLNSVAAIAATGVNYISIGALTHSVKALDISLLLY